jgi:cell division protein FtsL
VKLLSLKSYFCLFLLFLLIFQGFLLIYSQYQTRVLKNEKVVLEQQHADLQLSWMQLLLEQSTLVAGLRLEQVARENLQMVVPKPQNIIVVDEDT